MQKRNLKKKISKRAFFLVLETLLPESATCFERMATFFPFSSGLNQKTTKKDAKS